MFIFYKISKIDVISKKNYSTFSIVCSLTVRENHAVKENK